MVSGKVSQLNDSLDLQMIKSKQIHYMTKDLIIRIVIFFIV
jgi:hypothetical protein